MDLDYAAIYRDVNQVSRPVPTRQCSPVMAIQRMYFRLDELDVRQLMNPEEVKQLYVFADVVELEGDSVELPGSSQVTVVCRVLQIKRRDSVVIRLLHLNAVNCNARVLIGQARDRPPPDEPWPEPWVPPPSPFQGRTMAVSPMPGELSGDGRIVTILATHLVAPAGALGLRVQCPITVAYPDRPTSDGTVEWQVSPYSDRVAARSATPTVADTVLYAGVRWQNINEVQWHPSFRVAVPEPIPPQLLDNSNVVLGVEATTLISELVMEYQREAIHTVAATLQHVTWLNRQLVSSSTFRFANEQQIRALHFRVQALLKLPHRHDDGALIVPPLQYERYDRLIDLMTRAAESYDNAFRQLNLQIQQTEVLGSFLLEQNKAFAARERDMEIHHSQLVSLQEADLNAANEKINRLNGDLGEQSRAMEEAKADMDKGIIQYRDRLIAEAVFGVMAAIAQVCLAVFTGGATAAGAVATARQLSEAAKALQSVVRFLERLEQIVEIIHAVTDFLTNLQTLNQLNHIIGLPEMPELPSEADWDIFENEIVAVAEGMPTNISEVPVWKAKCKNVAALGREIIKSVAFMQQLQYDLAVNKMLQNVAQQQAERLESLKIQDLDNHLEMATELDLRTSRMLMALLKVLSLQTGAVAYHYLLQPRRLNGWVRMDSVWNALLRNAYDAVDALSSLGSPPTDVVLPYVVKDIPVGLLLRGDDFHFDIPVDGPAIPSAWFRVRIEYVELKFPATSDGHVHHLPTTSSGEVYILLQAARLFDDRSKDQVLHYQAASPPVFQYAYRLDSGQTTVSNRPTSSSSGHFFRMTPFTRWRLRLSASAYQNRGLAFPTATTEDAATEITITFHLTAMHRIMYRTARDIEA